MYPLLRIVITRLTYPALQNLNNQSIFHPVNLQEFRNLIESTTQTALYSFSPIKSMRRIIAVFTSNEPAIVIKNQLDGTAILGERVRVYFGEPTKLVTEGETHLQAPRMDKLFFISPPPSPPAGWEVRNEEPPNKEVHAEDLAAALAKLRARPGPNEPASPSSPETGAAVSGHSASTFAMEGVERLGSRSRSATIVFDPNDHANTTHLPAIAVEDTSEGEDEGSPMEGIEKRFMRTERPPVEVMQGAM